MKIAISATGSTLDDAVEARFGRCPYFIVVDPDTMAFEAYPNPNMSQGGGAGIQSAQLMADKGVSVMLTGDCGPNAFKRFGAAGIQVVTGVSGTVRQVVQQYASDTLAQATASNTAAHTGAGVAVGGAMGGQRGMGGGRAMGGRRGMGGGRGDGGGGGRGGRPSGMS